MSLPAFPDGLPCPLRDGYGFVPPNNIVRTDMQSGRARQRIEFTNLPTLTAPTLNWIFTDVQARLFEAWSAQVAGAGWFTIELLTPLGFDDYEVRFTETPKGGQLTGKFLWAYSAPCELRERPILDDGWAGLLPDYVLNADIFDYAMNREWPEFIPGKLLTQSGDRLLTEAGDLIILE